MESLSLSAVDGTAVCQFSKGGCDKYEGDERHTHHQYGWTELIQVSNL